VNSLQEWQKRWGIPDAAVADLLQRMGAVNPPLHTPGTEAYVQSIVRLEAPRFGVHLFRNNVGVAREQDPDTGKMRPVRYGLANDTKQMNETFKSGDLIGWRQLKITPAHVGTVVAQFVSRECKKADWTWSGDAREQAQLAWASLVVKCGGDARFVTGEGSFK
jgi:hypothetical protein